MSPVVKVCFFVILTNISILASSQEIKVTEFRSDPRDISARENAVFDANGDACAIIKTRTGLKNIKFSCDLEIRKIENHDGEYWLWVSPNTKQINIEAEGIGKLEYKLPEFAEEYNVYVIFLAATLPDKIVFKNVNSINFKTKPRNAEVFVDSIFIGTSPMSISLASNTFQYEFRKKRYSPVTGEFVYSETHKELFVPLKKDPKANRMFLTATVGGNKLGTPLFGLQTGMIGKTGWYFSFVPPINGKKSIIFRYNYSSFAVNVQNFISLIGEYSDTYTIKLQSENSNFYNHLRIKAGITRVIFKNTYLIAGLGYASSTEWFRLVVIPYSADPQLAVPLKNTYYGLGIEVFGMVCETGLIYRISNSFILNLNVSATLKNAKGSSYGDGTDTYFPFDGSFGIGYNF